MQWGGLEGDTKRSLQQLLQELPHVLRAEQADMQS